MFKIKFLGGCRNIGGSAILLSAENNKVLLDYGMVMGNPPTFPSSIDLRDLTFIVLSHCHADHSCGLPILYSGAAVPKLFATPPTIDLAKLIIRDSIKISKYYLPYEKQELYRMMKNTHTLGYNKKKLRNGISLTFFDAGHIPGSAMTLLEFGGKRILYTSDFNLTKTQLVNNAHLNFPSIDYLIIESTYALEEHPNRLQTEIKFIQEVKQITENEGILLVPAFAVGRSQEILSLLTNHNFKYPIHIDGMARTACKILEKHPAYIRDFKLYKTALKKARLISFHRKKKKQRLSAMSKPGVIIAPSGMLKGGTSRMYLEHLASNVNNGVFLVSYQIPESPGHLLLDEGVYISDNQEKITVDAQIKDFNFSSHSDKNQLWTFIKHLNFNPGAKVFCVHGEEDSCIDFSKRINEELKVEAFAPKINETF